MHAASRAAARGRALQGVKASPGEVEAALAGELTGRVERTGTLYHLPGRGKIVQVRAEREAAAERYLARQGPALKLMAKVPFVRLLSLSGGAAHRIAGSGRHGRSLRCRQQ